MRSDALCKLFLNTPIGTIEVLQSGFGVREITLDRDFAHSKDIIELNHDKTEVVLLKFEGQWHDGANDTIDWLKLFFSKERKPMELKQLPKTDNPILSKENFTGRVLRTLAQDVPSGKTVSYAKLAELCGSPKACRAVGQAMRTNPLPLVVPCHRVITSSGASGPFMRGKGDNIKKWLLNFESQY